MKRYLISLLAAIALPTAVNAEKIDKEIAEFCLKATDFAGCVKTMSKETNIKKIVPDEKKSGDEESLIVNSCPEGNAYVGNGLCRKVECEYPMDTFKAAKGHDQTVAGKSDWSCKKKIFKGVGLLTLGSEFTKATINEVCPNSEPEIGWKSSCEKKISKPTLITKKKEYPTTENKKKSDQTLSIKNENPSSADEKVSFEKEIEVGKWQYFDYEDTASGKTVYTASLKSENQINLSFPYGGLQKGELLFRNHPRHGLDIIFSIQEGQILSIDGITLEAKYFLVRFDNGEVERWNYGESTSQSSDLIFINGKERFVEKMLDSQKIFITVNLYQDGQETFIFDVKGLRNWSKLDKKLLRRIFSRESTIKYCTDFPTPSFEECMDKNGY